MPEFKPVFREYTKVNAILVEGLQPHTEYETIVSSCPIGYDDACGDGHSLEFRTAVNGNCTDMFFGTKFHAEAFDSQV